MFKISYYIICFSDAEAYCVHVYMLYPLQGGRLTGYCARWEVLVMFASSKGTLVSLSITETYNIVTNFKHITLAGNIVCSLRMI
jgi:hypothetical protein